MRLPYLEGLRGYMAIWVVFIHAIAFTPFYFEGFFTNGKLPVIVFILLSGFVTHILLTKEESYKFYLKRRALRLFPIYIVAFIISLSMINISFNILSNLSFSNPINANRLNLLDQSLNSNLFLNIISHLTLTHGLFPNEKFPFSYTIMGQSWSLTLEWQFYIIIPLLYKLIQSPIDKFKLLVFGITYCSLFLIALRYMNQISFLPNMFHFFLIGFFSYPLYKRYVKKGSNHLFIFLFFATIFVSLISYHYLIVMLLWCIVLWMQKSNNKIGDLFFNNKLSLYLGKISYSIYCVHIIVLIILMFFTQRCSLTDAKLNTTIIVVGGIFISILVSIFTYKYIEEPFIRWGKKNK
ncbi:acyltransferase [Sphingobacterium kyonggiense]|uniref:Acyltransferase n=1 Tax=Sphingobacterium kyonggiense TaxID=714075 RepID=A0ABP7YVM0_9SPHI